MTETIQMPVERHSRMVIANYTYDLGKKINFFYQNSSILGAEEENKKIFRIRLAQAVARKRFNCWLFRILTACDFV